MENRKNNCGQEPEVPDGSRIKNEFGNANSKDIWQNQKLCAQFLRRFTGISLFAHVQPEDIEDITENLRPFIGVEYEGDSVKRIRLRGEKKEIYVVGLLEHKSKVDYDVAFQLLKYMIGIWALYRNQMNKLQKNRSSLKEFRYPLIIPIVYYEGKKRWTADMHWKDRVELSKMFGQFVPDFTYKLVELHGYTNEEILSQEEELSLVMMLNRVQAEKDLDFSELPEEQRRIVDKILRLAPEDVLHVLAQMVYHLGLKLKLPDDKLIQYVRSVEDRDMGELWAHMDKINLPKLLQRLEKQQEALDREQEAMEERRGKLEERREALEREEEAVEERREALDRREEALTRRKAELEKEEERLKRRNTEEQEVHRRLDEAQAIIADLQAEIGRLKKSEV